MNYVEQEALEHMRTYICVEQDALEDMKRKLDVLGISPRSFDADVYYKL